MKYTLTLLLTFISALGFAQEAFPITVTDAQDIELNFQQAPQRVICLSHSCVQNLALIGIKPIAVGVMNYSVATNPVNFGEEAGDFEQIANVDSSPDFEQIAALAPDLVVGGPNLRAPLEGITPVYVQHYQSDSLEAFVLDTRNLGKILGLSDHTEAQIQAAFDRIEAYSQRSPKDKSLFITILSGERPVFWSFPTQQFNSCGLIEKVAMCLYPENDKWNEVMLEGLLDLDPDVVVLADYPPASQSLAEVVDSFTENPLWNELSAVKNGAIYILPPAQVEAYSIHSATAMLDAVMPLVYPEVFPEPLTEEQIDEILAAN